MLHLFLGKLGWHLFKTLAVPGEGVWLDRCALHHNSSSTWRRGPLENNCQQHRTTSHISNLPMPMPAPHLRRLSCPPPLVFHALPYRRRAPRNATAPTTTQPSPRLPFPSPTLHVAFVMVAGCRVPNKYLWQPCSPCIVVSSDRFT